MSISHGKSRNLALATALLCLSGLPLAPAASAKTTPVDVMTYFNPIQKKGYLNQNQDRIIKKKKFKLEQLPDVQAVSNKELGIFALLNSQQLNDPALLEQLLSRPDVNGLSLLLSWQQLQPQEEEFNWQPIDNALAAVNQHKKSLILRVATCGIDQSGESDTPKWVYDAGVKSMPYTTADGKSHLMPIFWDTTYLANWGNFVKELGNRYDKNPAIHSIGITGGGFGGGTPIVPGNGSISSAAAKQLELSLKKDHGMNQKQIVDHWKYAADIFPQAFPTARLNLDISPTTPNRAGQDALDEISDYLVYRYGQRVYLTRLGVANGKHGFDQYRVLLKFRPDTFTGYQLTSIPPAEELEKLSKFALDDGISFAELPVDMLESKDEAVQKFVHHLADHIGYKLISKSVSVPAEVPAGVPVKVGFTFMNVGSGLPYKPARNLDKDVASSFRLQVEFRDKTGNPVVVSVHTPNIPTNQWTSGKEISWEEDLKMPELKPGEYSVFMSLVDPDNQRFINFLDGRTQQEPTLATTLSLGNIKVIPSNASLGAKEAVPQ